jgi:choline-sulfatase
MTSPLERRQFLKIAFSGTVAALLPSLSCARHKKPNILLIITDQQHAKMMSCAGSRYVDTPAMDRLASRGTRFDRAYCTDPVCVPSRFSLMTGRMPSEIGMRSNSSRHIESIPEPIKMNGLGHLIKRAGYEVAYGGKVHLPKMSAEDVGFNVISEDERDDLARVCAGYIRREHENPFFLVASFINPHDICYMALRDFAETDFEKLLVSKGKIENETLDKALQLPEGMSREQFFATVCPPLPPNHLPQQDEPEAISWLLNQRPFRVKARNQYTDEQWRLHRWAYARLTERVDEQIGIVLDALEQSGKVKDTLVIFTSDHGDNDSAHKLEHKTVFYDESSRIPLIVSWPGVLPEGRVETEHLVSNGLDVLPTCCDFAGIDPPKDLQGASLRPILESGAVESWRTFLPVESEIGHMIVTKNYKYILYDMGAKQEQMLDLRADPHETRNALPDIDKKMIDEHREMFKKVFPEWV